MYLICYRTEQDHSSEMLLKLMGKSSSQHFSTLKSFGTIGTLIFKRKNALKKN